MLKLFNRKKKDNKGFTLVELVIVIAILAILVGLLAPQYTKYVEKSRKTADANNLEEIIGHIRQVTNTPVAIGFGINKPEQVKEFKQYADGIIVGSAIVNIIKEHGNHADLPLKEYIQSLTKEL